nr:RNA-directed DNA polymerase, eukaryota, reverse transcriptase zinc-binding domain protein [Tanacetum cinerariifolium]
KEFKDSQKVHEKGSTSKKNNNGRGILGSNRLTLLDSLVNEEELVPTTDKRKIADDFLHKKCEMNNMEMNDWSEEIKRVHRGRILTVRNEEGVRFENNEVPAQIVKHFEEFLGKSSQVLNLSCRNNIFRTKLSLEEALEMVRPISDPEIKNAMFEIEDSKALGPDGYTSRFYKTAWRIVGKEVSQAMREFFNTGKLLGEVNATLISLVPKIPIPGKVSDFRPIACCNVLYTCISRIMTKKLKGVLGKLVNKNQSAFISGRKNIEENAEFKYHYGCKKIEITHLCFADDLLVFCHGDLFFGGLSNAEQQSILNIIPFSVGKLPASVFLLPKQVIYEINKMLKGFVWCQGDLAKGKSKVSWNEVCKPKDQSGLGLKNLVAANYRRLAIETSTSQEICLAGIAIAAAAVSPETSPPCIVFFSVSFNKIIVAIESPLSLHRFKISERLEVNVWLKREDLRQSDCLLINNPKIRKLATSKRCHMLAIMLKGQVSDSYSYFSLSVLRSVNYLVDNKLLLSVLAVNASMQPLGHGCLWKSILPVVPLIATLQNEQPAAGVICSSEGNHAQETENVEFKLLMRRGKAGSY